MTLSLRSAVVLASLVLASLVTGCSSSDSDESRPQAVATTAGSGTKDLFLYGTIKRNGKPVRGVRMDLELNDELAEADAKVGDTLVSFHAAGATTDADGRFALTLVADDVPTKYFAGGADRDILNFLLNISTEKEFVPWNATLHPVGDPKVWRSDSAAVAADAAMRMDLDLGSGKLVTTDSFGQAEKSETYVMHGASPQ